MVLLSMLNAQADRFFVTLTNGDLYKVYAQSCSASFVGSTGLSFSDIALTPSGELFGRAGPELHRIDTTDASTSYVGESAYVGNNLVALNDTTLLTVAFLDLYALSTITLSATWIGDVGYTPIGDLTWYDGHLFMSSGEQQLVRMDSDDGYASLSSVTLIGSYDPEMPQCEGLATVTVADLTSSIVGFRQPDLFCFSPIDGSYETICQPPLPGWVPGAASAPPQPTPGIGCHNLPTGAGDLRKTPCPGITVTHDHLIIRVPNGVEVGSYWVIDPSGRVVSAGPLSGSSTTSVPLSSLASGLYSANIDYGSTSFSSRFVHASFR